MNLITKSIAIVSTLFLLTACENGMGSGGADGKGGNGPATPGSQADLTQNVGDRVFFAYNSSSLSAEAQSTLKRQAAWLKQYPDVNVTVRSLRRTRYPRI